jgi:hypothetical protein
MTQALRRNGEPRSWSRGSLGKDADRTPFVTVSSMQTSGDQTEAWAHLDCWTWGVTVEPMG